MIWIIHPCEYSKIWIHNSKQLNIGQSLDYMCIKNDVIISVSDSEQINTYTILDSWCTYPVSLSVHFGAVIARSHSKLNNAYDLTYGY